MNFRKLGDYFEKNGAGIATAVSMVLTGLSVYFAIRKADEGSMAKSLYIADKEILEEKPIADRKPDDDLMIKISYAKDIVRTYKESLICAGGAIGLTYLANRLNGQKIAGLAAALALNEDKLRKVYYKAEKVFGKGGSDDLHEMVGADPNDIPFDTEPERAKRRHRREEICLFYESFTGTLFESNCRDVDDAVTKAKHRIDRDPHHTLNYNKWRSLLGLEDAPCGVCVGWHRTYLPFNVYQKIICVDGRDVVGIFYENDPASKYEDWNRY